MTFGETRRAVTEGRKQVDQCMEVEKKRRAEAADKAAADSMKEEATSLVGPLDEEAEKLLPAARKLVESKGDGLDNPLEALTQAEKDLEVVLEKTVKAMDVIKSHLDGVKTASPRGPFGEAKSALVKLKVKAGTVEQKCRKQIAALKSAHKEVGVAARAAIISVFKKHVQDKGLSAEALFAELSKDGKPFPADALKAYLQKIPNSSLKPIQLQLGLEGFTSGISKLTMKEMSQSYHRVVKAIAITSAFHVKDSKTLRKLDEGEFVEVLETGKEDIGLPRVRCRALIDHKEGWVTEKGNQGSTFLEATGKPYLCCQEMTSLTEGFESTTKKIRHTNLGEVFEVIEGPRKEPPVEVQRIKGKSSKDGSVGWTTLGDASGKNKNFEGTKVLICKSSIAITNSFDISTGKAIRKLDVGEVLSIIEEPKSDATRSLLRVKIKSQKDEKEGWVTMKGNQGTAYVEETTKHYKCIKSSDLEASFASGGALVRALEEGETFEVLEGPKAETKQSANRVRGRNLSDGTEGWFTFTKKNMQFWSPSYKCRSPVDLCDDAECSKVQRKLEAGERLEALEPPTLCNDVVTICLRAESDGAVGFATIKAQGTVFLDPVRLAR